MGAEKNKGGFFEQIQGKINPVVLKYYYNERVSTSFRSFAYLLHVMQAHVLMLGRQRIIPSEAAGKLLAAMERLERGNPQMDPSLEDLYINLEHLIAADVGKDACGYMPAARSRNDVEAAMWRMELRDAMIELAEALLDHVRALHRRADETKEALFPGYTYGQQAMPVTMGHYLLGISAALLRDAQRALDCVDRFNLNPLGAAAMAGTSYPIDRELTGRLLGFDGVWEHVQDAISSDDYMLEAAGDAVIALTTLARLAEDIINWCSNEAGFADLPNDLIDSSTIMPQKRNPVICATVRAQARLAAGRYAGVCTACSVEFQASRDMTSAWEDVLWCVHTALGMCRISEAYTKGLIFKTQNMAASLQKGFSNATELADRLVMEGGLPFRTAHTVVGSAVSELFYKGLDQEALTFELLDEKCREAAGCMLPLTREQFERAKDFRLAVERRSGRGATSQAEISRMAALQSAEAARLEARTAAKSAQFRAAAEALRQAVTEGAKAFSVQK